jgi:hypothetical protein
MNRTILLAGCAFLAFGVLASLLLQARFDSSARAAEGILVDATAREATTAVRASLELPIPELFLEASSADEPQRPSARRVVDSPYAHARREFQTRYAGMPLVELQQQPQLVSERLRDAISAKFDDLHLHFDEHLAARRYGARVSRHQFHFKSSSHQGHSDPASSRTVLLADGTLEFHSIHFCTRSEESTYALLEELSFVRQALAQALRVAQGD